MAKLYLSDSFLTSYFIFHVLFLAKTMSESKKSRSGLRGSFRWPKRPKKRPNVEIVSLTYICDIRESKVCEYKLILSYGVIFLS